ncbi:MAG: preprotein translocase subunit SecG [Chthoniobacterales bacterium]|nr:preprotein translocase subunit SecG [Chthoniobacterales bacterium]
MWLLLPILITALVIVAFLLIIVVLMQRPKNEGLGAAFGSGMTDNLFGTQTTNILNRFTVWLGVLFFVLTLVISIVYVKSSSGLTPIQKELLQKSIDASKKNLPAAPKATASPGPTPSASPVSPALPTTSASPAAAVTK